MSGPAPAANLAGRLIGGALLGAITSLALGYAIDLAGAWRGDPAWGGAYRRWLGGGGWTWLPLFGAAAGAWSASYTAAGHARALCRALAVVLVALPAAWRPAVPGLEAPSLPASADGRIRAIRRLSFRDPASVAQLLPLSRDARAEVRARAALALGVNTIVSDIEHDRPGFPSRHAGDPLRDSLRIRLLELLADPDETVRIEAARALWNAPRAFGRQTAAAETLADLLERRATERSPGRLAWLALDAAAGVPDSGLRAAALRFAAATPDTALASAAQAALAADRPPADRTAH